MKTPNRMEHPDLLDPEVIARIDSLPLRARMVVEGFVGGSHKSPFRGFNVEFAEHREYSPGDEPRYIDWTTYARTEKYHIKLFEEETNMRVYILLDISGSMGFSGEKRVSKLSYGNCLAASLAYLALRQKDAVGLCLFNEGLARFVPPSSRLSHLREITDILEQNEAAEGTDVGRSFSEIADTMHRRGLVVVISDFWDEEETVIRSMINLRHMKFEVVAFHVLDPLERSLEVGGERLFVDAEKGTPLPVNPMEIGERYREKLKERLNRLRFRLREHAVDYVMTDTSVPYGDLLTDYLRKRRQI